MGAVIVVLLTITVPWFSTNLQAILLGLPLWFWYALALNVVFATAVCFMLEKSWDTSQEEKPEGEEESE